MSTTAIMSERITKGLQLMGNYFELSVVATDRVAAEGQIEQGIAEIRRIEALLTTFNPDSQTNQINAAAGITAVAVDVEVFDLIDRSLRISALTQGAFDITYGSIDKRFWNFDKTMTRLPDAEQAKALVRLINYRNVLLDRSEHTVFLKEKGMRIGFGGIGKGYAADRARDIMQKNGADSGIVNASGDVTVWGRQPDGRSWTVGIADPNQKNFPFAAMELNDASIATSGDYEKFAVIDGKRYSHTIDPKTGYPVHGIKSVTIICKSAELADAMATPVMVMGIKAGLSLINQMRDIAGVIVDDKDNIFTSSNINSGSL